MDWWHLADDEHASRTKAPSTWTKACTCSARVKNKKHSWRPARPVHLHTPDGEIGKNAQRHHHFRRLAGAQQHLRDGHVTVT